MAAGSAAGLILLLIVLRTPLARRRPGRPVWRLRLAAKPSATFRGRDASEPSAQVQDGRGGISLRLGIRPRDDPRGWDAHTEVIHHA
jgi:hypothetical protein